MNLHEVHEKVGREREWKLVTTLTGMLGALIAKKLLRAGSNATRSSRSPDTPFDATQARFSWPNAIVWAAAAGIGLVVARILSNRVATIGWEVATGTLPPGAEEAAAG